MLSCLSVDFLNTTLSNQGVVTSVFMHLEFPVCWNLCFIFFFFCAGQQSHLPRNHYQHEVLRSGSSLPAMWQEEFSTLSQSSSFQINKNVEVVHHNKSLKGHAVFSRLISLSNYSSTASDLKTAGILHVNTVLLSALCFVSHDLPSDY